MPAEPKSAKKESQLRQLFALSGSVSVKAACKHVDEIDPCSLLREKQNRFIVIFIFFFSRQNLSEWNLSRKKEEVKN